jgi:hypothetical protein
MLDAPNIIEIREDERLLRLESARNHVLCVLKRERVALLEFQLRLEQELLVVCERRPSPSAAFPLPIAKNEGRTRELNDEGHVKDFLEPLGEDKGDHVAEMHAVATRSSSSIKVERLSLLEAIQNRVELAATTQNRGRLALVLPVSNPSSVPMRKEGATTKEKMRFPSRELLEAVEEGLVNWFRSKILDEVIVVDGNLSGNRKERRKNAMNKPCDYKERDSEGTRMQRVDCWCWGKEGEWKGRGKG